MEWSLHLDVFAQICQMTSSQGGPICEEVQLQTTSVCVPSPRSQSMGRGCVDPVMGGSGPVCLFPSSPPDKCSDKGSQPSVQKDDNSSPGLAEHALVLGSGQIPVCLPNRLDLLSQPFKGNLHRDLQNLNLHAWLLETKISGNKVSLTMWQREVKLVKDGLPDLSMKQSGPFSFDGVRRIRWTSIHHL